MKIFKILVATMLMVLMCTSAFAAVNLTPNVRVSYFQQMEQGKSASNDYLFIGDVKIDGYYNDVYFSVKPELMKTYGGVNVTTPLTGLGLETLIGYNLVNVKGLQIVPVAGLYYVYLTRDKQVDSNRWTYTNDLYGKLGVQAKYGVLYANLGVLAPLYSRSNSTLDYDATFKVREDLEAGVEYKIFKVGAFRKRLVQEAGWTEEAITGVLFGIKF